jgi:mono/diheme cytochrome c family protein
VSRIRIAATIGVVLLVLGIYVLAGGLWEGESSSDDETVSTPASTTKGGEPGADPEQPLSPVEQRGQELFVENCGACHTLDAAGTAGAVGPNLDEAQNNEAEVLMAIEQGGQEPGGAMPQNVVTGDDAKAVAKFVANSGPGV